MLFIILAVIMIMLVLYTLTVYSREGDIKNTIDMMKKITNKKLKRKQIVEKLYHLALYKGVKVRWNLYLIIAIAISIIVLSLINCFSFQNLFIYIPFVFAGLYVPFVYEMTHVQNGMTAEASMLYSLYKQKT